MRKEKANDSLSHTDACFYCGGWRIWIAQHYAKVTHVERIISSHSSGSRHCFWAKLHCKPWVRVRARLARGPLHDKRKNIRQSAMEWLFWQREHEKVFGKADSRHPGKTWRGWHCWRFFRTSLTALGLQPLSSLSAASSQHGRKGYERMDSICLHRGSPFLRGYLGLLE